MEKQTVVLVVTLDDADTVDALGLVRRHLNQGLAKLANDYDTMDPHWTFLGPLECDEAQVGVFDRRTLVTG